MNTFGNIYRLTSFGESHGPGIGGVIDGCPAGIELDTAFIQQELNRRKPGQSRITTPRKEDDEVQFLSGIYEGKTTGTPIGFIIWNKNQHSSDYDNMKTVYRPSHADYTYQTKYGIRDPRGGGRSSARETIARCVAGAIAKLALKQYGIQIQAYTSQVGPIQLAGSYQDYDLSLTEESDVRCPDPKTASEMETLIAEVKSKGDTIGGVITCVAKGVPVGLGEPVFGKLHAALGHAMLTINAVKGFEYGDVKGEGIKVMDQTLLIQPLLPPPGVLTQRMPTEAEVADMDFGFAMAKEIGRLDIGQTVVVKDRALMAVEAIEGTDACILRGGTLGKGVIVAKTAKPAQDNRFDMPSIGTKTMESMIAAGATGLVIEAGRTLLVEKEKTLALADAHNITIVAR